MLIYLLSAFALCLSIRAVVESVCWACRHPIDCVENDAIVGQSETLFDENISIFKRRKWKKSSSSSSSAIQTKTLEHRVFAIIWSSRNPIEARSLKRVPQPIRTDHRPCNTFNVTAAHRARNIAKPRRPMPKHTAFHSTASHLFMFVDVFVCVCVCGCGRNETEPPIDERI